MLGNFTSQILSNKGTNSSSISETSSPEPQSWHKFIVQKFYVELLMKFNEADCFYVIKTNRVFKIKLFVKNLGILTLKKIEIIFKTRAFIWK